MARSSTRMALCQQISRRRLLGLALGGTMALACSALLPAAAQAADAFVINCHAPTPSSSAASHPGVNKIILSNNLARPAGKAMVAPGQLLHITGRVTDENCVPVINAIIDLWQTNPFGDYRYATRDELLNPEPLFAGSGRAVTDNMGRYEFTTLFPGAYGRHAPHVNLRITHPDFSSLNTTMYFRGDRRNSSDPRFTALSSTSQSLLLGDVTLQQPENPDAGLRARFDIVLKGSDEFRRY